MAEETTMLHKSVDEDVGTDVKYSSWEGKQLLPGVTEHSEKVEEK